MPVRVCGFKYVWDGWDYIRVRFCWWDYYFDFVTERNRANALQDNVNSLTAEKLLLESSLNATQAEKDAIQVELEQAKQDLANSIELAQDAEARVAEAEASGEQILTDQQRILFDNAANLSARAEGLSVELNKTSEQWQSDLDILNQDIETIDTRLSEIDDELTGTLTPSERNKLIEERARISLEKGFKETEATSTTFNIAKIADQEEKTRNDMDAFMDSINGLQGDVDTTSLTTFSTAINRTIEETEAAREAEETARLVVENELDALNIQHQQLQLDYEAGQITIEELNTEQERLNNEIVRKEVEIGIDETTKLEQDFRDKFKLDFDIGINPNDKPNVQPPMGEGQLDPTSLSVGASLGQPNVPVAPVVKQKEKEPIKEFLGAPEIPPVIGTMSKASTVGDRLKVKNKDKNTTNVFT